MKKVFEIIDKQIYKQMSLETTLAGFMHLLSIAFNYQIQINIQPL